MCKCFNEVRTLKNEVKRLKKLIKLYKRKCRTDLQIHIINNTIDRNNRTNLQIETLLEGANDEDVEVTLNFE